MTQFYNAKYFVKKLLASAGLMHPALGIKIGPEEKTAILLAHKTPALNVFVETGTEHGGMIERLQPHFQKIYSVELDENLYQKARERFRDKNMVHLLRGDSAVEIKKVLAELHEPALFWLDAHGSGEITGSNSPILKEVKAIFNHPLRGKHVIVIDDARHFDTATISALKSLAKKNGYRFAIKDGIFRLRPL